MLLDFLGFTKTRVLILTRLASTLFAGSAFVERIWFDAWSAPCSVHTVY